VISWTLSEPCSATCLPARESSHRIAGRSGWARSLSGTKVSRWWVMPIAAISRASTEPAASRRASRVERHQSSAFCSPQPGLGEDSGKVARPSATALPSMSQTTALVAVVEQSIPMT
jgi:hypothetical protein